VLPEVNYAKCNGQCKPMSPTEPDNSSESCSLVAGEYYGRLISHISQMFLMIMIDAE